VSKVTKAVFVMKPCVDVECVKDLIAQDRSYNVIMCDTQERLVTSMAMGPTLIKEHKKCIVMIDNQLLAVLTYSPEPREIDPYSIPDILKYNKLFYNTCCPDEMIQIYNAVLLIKMRGGGAAIAMHRLILNHPVKMFYFPEFRTVFDRIRVPN
jgi:hypothetical protein